ncbi:hypothetical protein TrCOL_g13612 [Triparma columacea]|uniref:Heat shock factor-binding protein 1 n=1 Tax=Triparma columacea TaxID=722753 RepID=A0A9W7FV06_9STRA|nr:hypothetical protein TrCOL_g13612 [Triparma columacea]
MASSELSSPPPTSEDAEGAPTNSQDLTLFVQSLLTQMQSRFTQMSDAIIGRIDEMGGRIDDLERSIGELMEQAGVEGQGEKEETKNS